jgi:hypothetical protein
MQTVTKTKPVKPPEDVTFICETCDQRRPFAQAHATPVGTECSDCFHKKGSPGVSAEAQERASVFSSFVGWLRRD